MEKNKILSKLEKCSPWIKINRKLSGPVLIISVVYIVSAFYFWGHLLKLDGPLQILCFVGFAIFLLAIYLVFTGFLLRSVNKKDNNG